MEISAGLSHRRLQVVIAIFFGWWMTLADICGLCCCPPKTVCRQPSRMSRQRRNESVARSFVPYVPIAGVNSQRATSTTTLPSWVCSGSSLHPSHLLRTSCMLKAKDLLDMFWGEAVMTAIYVLSRSSSKGAGGRTSYELWTGITPSVQHLRTFECVVHVKDTRPHLRKLNDRSKPMIFMGYERVYDPVTKRIHIMRDVVFNEDGKWCWEDSDVNTEFIVNYVPVDNPKVVIVHHGDQAATPMAGTPAFSPAPAVASPHTTSPPGGQVLLEPTIMHASPSVGAEVTLDVDHDKGVPLRFRTLRNIDETGPVLRLIQQELGADLLMVHTEEPTSFQEAQAHDYWH
jgi:hypothetical protein